jgi:hypothetical protein
MIKNRDDGILSFRNFLVIPGKHVQSPENRIIMGYLRHVNDTFVVLHIQVMVIKSLLKEFNNLRRCINFAL